ncbi:MAG: hypothetical protein P1V97_30730, partial [Planctomycetota bacterium]|nr:hypothetical protein [Planctomycetota bacterium]
MIYIFWTLLSLLIVILITVYWEPLFPRWLRKRLERELAEKLPLQINIGKARYRFLAFLLLIEEFEARGEQGEVIKAQTIEIKDPVSFLWRGAVLSISIKNAEVEKSAQCLQLFRSQGLNISATIPGASESSSVLPSGASPASHNSSPGNSTHTPSAPSTSDEVFEWELNLEALTLDWPQEDFASFPSLQVQSASLSGGSAGFRVDELSLECSEELSLSLVDDLGGSGQLGLALSLQRAFLDRLGGHFVLPWNTVNDSELVLSGRFELEETGAQIHHAKIQWGALKAEGSGQARFHDGAFSCRVKTELDQARLATLNEGLPKDKRVSPEYFARLPESLLTVSAQFSSLKAKSECFIRVSADDSSFEASAFTDKDFWPLQVSGQLATADLERLLDIDGDSMAFAGAPVKSHLTVWQSPSWRCEGVLSSPAFEIQVNPGASPVLFPFTDCSLNLSLDDKELHWSEVKAGFLDGQLDKGDGRLMLQSELQSYEGTIDYKDLTVEKWPTGSEDGLSSVLKGKGSGWFEYRGDLEVAGSSAGDGSLKVEDAHYTFLNGLGSWAKTFG